jgi:hypothetical protein
MLAETQRHRAEMIHRMVEHHRPLFGSMLETSVADKDTLFFRAHMEAAHLRSSLHGGGNGGATPMGDPLYRALEAQAELDHIENSRAWQSIQRWKRRWPFRIWARWKYGDNWDRAVYADPVERLTAIKNSRAYRMIQAVKRTPVHRVYARRRYGSPA